jgi:hypothetical protein
LNAASQQTPWWHIGSNEKGKRLLNSLKGATYLSYVYDYLIWNNHLN